MNRDTQETHTLCKVTWEAGIPEKGRGLAIQADRTERQRARGHRHAVVLTLIDQCGETEPHMRQEQTRSTWP